MPLAARQKPTNATSVCRRASRWSSTPAAAGAANTSTFFVHCLGRAVRMAAFSVEEWRTSGSVGGVARDGSAAADIMQGYRTPPAPDPPLPTWLQHPRS